MRFQLIHLTEAEIVSNATREQVSECKEFIERTAGFDVGSPRTWLLEDGSVTYTLIHHTPTETYILVPLEV